MFPLEDKQRAIQHGTVAPCDSCMHSLLRLTVKHTVTSKTYHVLTTAA